MFLLKQTNQLLMRNSRMLERWLSPKFREHLKSMKITEIVFFPFHIGTHVFN